MDSLSCLELKPLGAGAYGYCYKVFVLSTRNEVVKKTVFTELNDLPVHGDDQLVGDAGRGRAAAVWGLHQHLTGTP